MLASDQHGYEHDKFDLSTNGGSEYKEELPEHERMAHQRYADYDEIDYDGDDAEYGRIGGI